jgi:glycosyltransferase involved in cell wall biosynthesis
MVAAISPIISVVMPLFNKEREVARAIRSVLAQSVTGFELLVINDGSTDKGPEIVHAIQDSRIRTIDQPNAGVSAARNTGIREAGAELIAFLDADDEWTPDFLETLLRLKRNFPSCSVFATNYFFSTPDGTRRPTILRGLARDFSEGILSDYFAVAFRSDPPLWSSAVGVSKTAITAIGGFPVGITSGEDLLTWAKLAVKNEIAYSTKPCAVFWTPIALSDRCGRIPQKPDRVGLELRNLLEYSGGENTSLKHYIALWHKMRANIFMRLGKKKEALRELMRAVRLSGVRFDLLLLSFFTILPGKFGVMLYRFLRSMWRKVPCE